MRYSKTDPVVERNNTQKQIRGITDAWLVKDNIDLAYECSLPVWLFGFLY